MLNSIQCSSSIACGVWNDQLQHVCVHWPEHFPHKAPLAKKRMIMKYNVCVFCALIGHNFPTVLQMFVYLASVVLLIGTELQHHMLLRVIVEKYLQKHHHVLFEFYWLVDLEQQYRVLSMFTVQIVLVHRGLMNE